MLNQYGIIALTTLLMYKSWQQPGAVCNCTMREYNRIAEDHSFYQGVMFKVNKVNQHNTRTRIATPTVSFRAHSSMCGEQICIPIVSPTLTELSLGLFMF